MLRDHARSTKKLAAVALDTLENASILIARAFWDSGDVRMAIEMGIAVTACHRIIAPSITSSSRLEFMAAAGASMLIDIISPPIMADQLCYPLVDVVFEHPKWMVLQEGKMISSAYNIDNSTYTY
jgi:hypothetical protein